MNSESQEFLKKAPLEQLTIPRESSSIDNRLFNIMYNLQHIDVDDDNSSFASLDGVLFSKDLQTLIQYPRARKGKYKFRFCTQSFYCHYL
jgi:hypothetical protein